MKASIGIQETRQGVPIQAAHVDVRLVFTAEYEGKDFATRRRIELRAVKSIEDWLLVWKQANEPQEERR